MSDDSVKQRRQLEARVEHLTAEAKKLLEAGKESAALDLYRLAADELPGAPWLQHRTAEISRKLKKNDIAIIYFRRAATAFELAEFSKRAVGPLRTAWTLALDGLPSTSRMLVEVAAELMQLHRRLGFAADATVVLERTNTALRTRGFSEIPPHGLETTEHDAAAPPSSRNSAPPASDIAPRGSGSPPAENPLDSRSRTLARLLGRR